MLNVFLASWISIFLNNIDYTRSLIEIILRLVIHPQKTDQVLFHLIIPSNCRKKDESPLNGQCLAQDIVYKCIVSTSMNPDKTYLGMAEFDFKKRFNNHINSFRHKRYSKDTTLSKYIWETKKEYNEMSTLNGQ